MVVVLLDQIFQILVAILGGAPRMEAAISPIEDTIFEIELSAAAMPANPAPTMTTRRRSAAGLSTVGDFSRI